MKRLAAVLQGTSADQLVALVRDLGRVYLDHIDRLDGEIARLNKRLRQLTKDDEASARLQTMPGLGPITAAAIEAFAPPMATFKRGRDFAAWLGLVPRQHSTGGKPRLGRTFNEATVPWRATRRRRRPSDYPNSRSSRRSALYSETASAI